jgi:hypothetical protein
VFARSSIPPFGNLLAETLPRSESTREVQMRASQGEPWGFDDLDGHGTKEMRLIGSLVLPLNIEGNKHTFCRVLSKIRSGARAHAARLPVRRIT